MLKNLNYIQYTYLHRKSLYYFIKTNKYLNEEDRKLLLQRAKIHDMDKMVLYLFWEKKDASKYHREHNAHHVSEYIKLGNTPNRIDILESIFDYECAALTKTDKPLNAFDTLEVYYPELIPLYKDYLKDLHMDSSYTAITDDSVKYINQFSIDENTLLEEIAIYLVENEDNVYTRLKEKCCSKEEYENLISFYPKKEDA